MLDKVVKKFLTDNVEVKNPWDMDVICFRDTNDVYYFETLIYDINLIFGISAEHINNIIERWVKEFYPYALLDGYFKLPINVVYAPYVPMQHPPIIMGLDPYEFNPRQTIISRYTISTNTVAIQHVRVEPEMDDGELL